MALSDIDRNLLDRCLTRKPRAWEDFVDRFMGLVVHVTNHSAQCRSIRLSAEDREDLCAEVFLAMLKDDLAVLRHFRRQSSLATYLTVIARRVVVREMLGRKSASRLSAAAPQTAAVGAGTSDHSASDRSASDRSASDQHERRVEDREEVARLLEELDGDEAQVVRMYHLEGKSYQEISSAVGMPENSVGPTLSRAREKMRRAGAGPAAS
ncbi:MAG TPA: sigma-70 family RNA polymerase sigma factor [Pirellulales bacterium]|nr:sigma-70 family RNA polymerase sigma factor [Pirellulales bacterium]